MTGLRLARVTRWCFVRASGQSWPVAGIQRIPQVVMLRLSAIVFGIGLLSAACAGSSLSAPSEARTPAQTPPAPVESASGLPEVPLPAPTTTAVEPPPSAPDIAPGSSPPAASTPSPVTVVVPPGPTQRVVRLNTRPGVTLRVLEMMPVADPKGTLILFTGGDGRGSFG